MGDLGRISILLAIALLGPIHARGQESALRLDPIGTFVSPVFVTHAGDGSGRLFVVEQAGVIRALKPGVAGSTAFLDIRDRVLAGGERGLLGLAFHPAFEANRRFFVNYTRRNDGATVIAGYEATPDGSMSAGQETILLVVEQPFANHNGGMLAFGPDGFLYIGSGDGGSAFDPGNRAQDTTTLLGKLLRIDVDSGGPGSYSSPPTNPLAGGPGRDEVFATGFRNPWRFSFDRENGALWVGDVGQSVLEEVDVASAGGNYGWRVLEGTACTGRGPASCDSPELIPPVTEYAHTGGRCSITGGYVYRGSGGAVAAGAYLFGDYCTGEIFMFRDGIQSVLLDTAMNISSFGEDESGELFVVDLGGGVYRIAPPGGGLLTFTREGEGAGAFAVARTRTIETGSIRILAASGAGMPETAAILEFRPGDRLVSEVVIAARPPVARGRFPVEIGGPVRTGVAFMNPVGQPVTVRFAYTDTSGVETAAGEVVLPGDGQRAAFLDQAPWAGPGQFQGAFSFEADSPVGVLALRGRTNERGDFLMAEIPIVDLDSPPLPGIARMPLLVAGGGYRTEVVLVNRSGDTATGVIRAVGAGEVFADGATATMPYAVAPGSVQVFGTTGSGPTRSGHLRIEPGVGPPPVAVGVVGLSSNGIVVSEAGTHSGSPVQRATFALESRGAFGAPDSARPALALANAGEGPAVIGYTLFDSEGAPVGAGLVEVPLEGQVSVFVHELPGLGAALGGGGRQFLGTLRLEAATPFVAYGLRARWSDRGEFLFATNPAPSGAEDAGRYVPHFAVGGDYALRLVLYSGSATGAEGTVEFRGPEGGAWGPPVGP
jgi:hypothetical protein